MSIYSCYSDESGSYTQDPDNKTVDNTPRFYRVNYMINTKDYNFLRENYRAYKTLFGLPLEPEFKYTFLFPILMYQNKGWDKPKINGIEPFIDIAYDNLFAFVEQCLRSLDEVGYEVIIIVTDNRKLKTCTEKRLYEMHLEDLIPRVCQSISSRRGKMGTFYFDSEDNIEKMLRDSYHRIIKKNKFNLPYDNLKESLNFEDSEHSIGIRLADYVTGCCAGFIKSTFNKSRGRESRKLFMDYVFNNLRSDRNRISGYGIKGVPINKAIEDRIIREINKETGGYHIEKMEEYIDYV